MSTLNKVAAHKKKESQSDAGSARSSGTARGTDLVPSVHFDPLRFTRRVVTEEELQVLIAEAAYYRAKHRDFAPGHEIDDWVAAEREVSDRVKRASGAPEH